MIPIEPEGYMYFAREQNSIGKKIRELMMECQGHSSRSLRLFRLSHLFTSKHLVCVKFSTKIKLHGAKQPNDMGSSHKYLSSCDAALLASMQVSCIYLQFVQPLHLRDSGHFMKEYASGTTIMLCSSRRSISSAFSISFSAVHHA